MPELTEDPTRGLSSTEPEGSERDPSVDAPAATDPTPDEAAIDPTDPPSEEIRKEESRAAYELRQIKKLADTLRKENEGYKRRDDEARKAALTAEQRLKEERDEAVREMESLRSQILQQKVAAEFKLPPALAVRLIGTDEEALRADAAELARFIPRPKVGSTTDPVRESSAPPTFTRAQLRDPAFFRANEAAILQAQREGRISAG